MLATTVDFLKESGQVLLIMTGPPLRCHPWHLSANANIVFALPLRLNHFPRKSHSLRRIYVRGSSPFLLGYERHPNYLDRAFENTCAEVKNKNLVCAKNQEIHADNSKTGIRYVKKSRKHSFHYKKQINDILSCAAIQARQGDSIMKESQESFVQ